MLATIDKFHKDFGVPRALFPILGGFTTGLIALAYPEILYWGFENVDLLLESRPFVKTLSAELLAQLVVIKIFATSLCRASGLVGGYYAPSLFIGAATGMAYGKFIGIALSEPNTVIDFSIFEVASPQAYGLVLFYIIVFVKSHSSIVIVVGHVLHIYLVLAWFFTEVRNFQKTLKVKSSFCKLTLCHLVFSNFLQL